MSKVKPLKLLLLLAIMGLASGVVSWLLGTTISVTAQWIWFPISLLLSIGVGIAAAARGWLE